MRRAFTLLELLATAAGLMIVLGMMVALARHVRAQAATELTRETLAILDSQAQAAGWLRDPPVPTPLTSSQAVLPLAAAQANAAAIRPLLTMTTSAAFSTQQRQILQSLAMQDLPRDAWGSPIVLMPHQHPRIGIAPLDRPFFLSAGPDRDFLSIEDNLYSYEEPAR